ncbi:PrpF domain-containing protein [Mammaliicoccus lentus]|uniref:PrpF protein n=1 Tax=Mammaliicoccus lentus TaxID=42858 RepID=A0ABS6GXT8_MAMLE|nr:PrpF domain-containing protein [Mammaliicoccus lentus]MBU6113482.1 PrpF protein [Mammaliicoccus lentus]
MDRSNVRIPCVLMRGGTSKGLIIKDMDLPKDTNLRDEAILKIYGSSKNGQIDGIGGGTSLTSKLGIVGISENYDYDIYYTFGQVSIYENNIDFNVTCGNMASAVGLYAVQEGLVTVKEPYTKVRILNTNTNKIMEVEVPVSQNTPVTEGDYQIDGVSQNGAKINVSFLDPDGAFTGKLFPSGNLIDTMYTQSGKTFNVSILDTGNIVAFVHASAFNLIGPEGEDVINNEEILNEIEELRIAVGIKLGIFKTEQSINPQVDALPKIALVANPENDSVDIIGRYISMGKLHKAFAVSGSIALAAACKIPNTIPNLLVNEPKNNMVVIGHPSGTIPVEIFIDKNESDYSVVKGSIGRTARRIMEGYALVPTSIIEKDGERI